MSTKTTPLKTTTKTRHRALFAFEASRDDEMTLHVDDIIIVSKKKKNQKLKCKQIKELLNIIINILKVDHSVKSDEGWSWGECKGRQGLFPTGFTEKISDLE